MEKGGMERDGERERKALRCAPALDVSRVTLRYKSEGGRQNGEGSMNEFFFEIIFVDKFLIFYP